MWELVCRPSSDEGLEFSFRTSLTQKRTSSRKTHTPLDNVSPPVEADRLERLAFGPHANSVASPPIGRLARSAEAELVAPSRWPSTQRRCDPRDGLCGPRHRETRQKSRTWTAPIARRTTRE